MKSLSALVLLTFFLASCSTTSGLKVQSISGFKMYKMTNAPFAGTTFSGQKIRLGGFSGLVFLEEKDEALYFQTVTDRGPNGEPVGNDRVFLLPEFSPMVLILKADLKTNELTVAAEIKLKKKDGTPLTGLPNTRLEENPTDVYGLYYSVDPHGLDIEGLTLASDGGWWMADEYGPSLVRFNEEGRMIKRLTPSNELPRMYSERKTNRGFEGIARIGQKVFGILQSPLPGEKNFSRIVEIDLETMKTSAEYFYPFEQGNDKIGDMVAAEDNILFVLEQNGKIGEKSRKTIYKIELGASDELVKKSFVADLKSTPFNDVEKVEGLALIDKRRLAVVYDNDFQLDGKTNLETGLTPMNQTQNQLMILEFTENLY